MFEANILLYVPVALLIMAVPGPANTLVMSRAAGSLRDGFLVIAGILAANIVLLTATILGVSSIVLASQPAFLALKWAGAAYLAYLGVSMIVSAGKAPSPPDANRSAFAGFLTGVTNPKALIFYFSFLPQFVTDRAPVRDQLIGLSIVDSALIVLVFGAYALAGAQLMRWLRAAKVRAWLDRCVGAVLIASAVAVLRTARPAQ